MKHKNLIFYILTLVVTVASVSLIVYLSFSSFYDLSKNRQVKLCESALGEEAAKINEYLEGSSKTIQTAGIMVDTIMQKDWTSEEIEELLVAITDSYLASQGDGFTGVYGYFDGKYIDGLRWEPPVDYEPTDRIWYREAIKGNGKIVVIPPYIDAQTGESMLSVSLMLSDKKSVISLDVSAGKLKEIAKNIGKNDQGYGFIIRKNGDIIAHADDKYDNLNAVEEYEKSAYSTEADEILSRIFDDDGGDSEINYFSTEYKDRNIMIFSQNVLDDWYIAMVLDSENVFHSEKEVLFKSILLALLIVGIVMYFCTSNAVSEARLREQTGELRNKADELKKASVEKSKFLANMSHEIRTPINAVLGMNEMIMRESNDSAITGYSNNIRSAGKTLLSIINDILDFSKIEAGEMPIIVSEYDTMTLLRDAYNVIAKRAEDKKIQLCVYNNSMTPRKLLGDETRIRQVFTNLMNNAIKYTSEGLVSIELDFAKESQTEGAIILSVSDTGIGISDDDKERLFASFRRLDERRNKNIEGTGLGLSISKQLVELMGGHISFESTYGMGSKFYAYIPQKIVDDTPMGIFEGTKAVNVEKINSYKERFHAPEADILVVDDVTMNLDVIRGLLKRTKVRITTATNGYDCVDLAKKNHYDIIFMDHLMPDIDGIETLKRLRAVEDCVNMNTPVIILTANAVAGAKEEYLKEGFVDYVSKPVQGNQLEEVVYQYLPKHKIEWERTDIVKPTEPVIVSQNKVMTERIGNDVRLVEKSDGPTAVYLKNTEPEKKRKNSSAQKPVKEETGVKTKTDNRPALIRGLRYVRKKLFDPNFDISEIMMNIAILCMVLGGSVGAVVTWFLGGNLTSLIAIGSSVLIGVLYLIAAFNGKKSEYVANFIELAVIDILFPIIFFNSGGIYSGMPIWYVFGLFMPWVLSKGIWSYLIYAITVTVDISTIIVSVRKPYLVTNELTGMMLVVDVIVAMVTMTVFLAAFLRYQNIVFRKQRKKLEKRTKELHRSFQEIEKANNAKTEFLTNMSHEIRTPIHAIIGYSQMIAEKTKEKKTAEYAENVEQSGRNLLSVVSDIMDYTGVDSSDFELEFVPAETASSIIDILSYAQYNCHKKGLELDVAVDPNIPTAILGDAVRYSRVAIKLVSNAIKYTDSGKVSIVIVWKDIEGTDKGKLTFSVADTGIGMKPEELDELRRQCHDTENGLMTTQGAGIGLAYASRILAKMGSEVKAESSYGKGSRFWFTIRPHVVDPRPIGEITYYNEMYRIKGNDILVLEASGARILVVDDNPMNLDLIGRFLESTKINIDYAEDGAEAVKMARENDYDIIFMDHMLPIMDGVEAFKVLREEHVCDETPIVVVTANAVAGEKKKYLDIGFDEYLSKPVDKQELLKILAERLPACEIDSLIKGRKEEADRYSEPLEEADNSSETEEETPALSEEDLERLKKYDFLDTATGLEYCANEVDFFETMLKSYCTNSRAEEIKKAYADRDFENYRIFVHAVKGTSLTIGAVDLSEHMKSLEFAARDGDIAFIDEHHAGYLAEYEEILGKIKESLEQPGEQV